MLCDRLVHSERRLLLMKTKLGAWALALALALPGGALVACGEAKEAANEVGNEVGNRAEKAADKIEKEAKETKDKATDGGGGNGY
jgi:hypothetical protein